MKVYVMDAKKRHNIAEVRENNKAGEDTGEAIDSNREQTVSKNVIYKRNIIAE